MPFPLWYVLREYEKLYYDIDALHCSIGSNVRTLRKILNMFTSIYNSKYGFTATTCDQLIKGDEKLVMDAAELM